MIVPAEDSFERWPELFFKETERVKHIDEWNAMETAVQTLSKHISPSLERLHVDFYGPNKRVWGKHVLDPASLKKMMLAFWSRDFQEYYAFPGESPGHHCNMVPFLDSVNHGYDLTDEFGNECLNCGLKR